MDASVSEPIAAAFAWLRRTVEVGVDEGDLAAHIAPAYLAGWPRPIEALRRISAETGAIVEVDIAQHGDWSASAAVIGEWQIWLTNVIVEPEPPHRLSWLSMTKASAVHDRQPITRDHSRQRGTDAVVTEMIDDLDLAGFAGVAVRNGRVEWHRCEGRSDIASARPVTPATPFRVGSVTKPVTALGVLRLVEEGLIELDDRVNDHLRAYELRGAGGELSAVTVRHLLTHTGGRLGVGAAVYHEASEPPPDLATTYGGVLAAAREPGRFAYDNHGYATLGQLVADVTGVPFPDWMSAHILEPLGMTTASYRPSPADAVLYANAGSRLVELAPYEPIVHGAGALRASIDDLSQLLLALTGSSEAAPVSDGMIATMLEGHLDFGNGRRYGLGMPIVERDGKRVAYHTGGGPGVVAIIAVAPEEETGIAFVTNTDDPGYRPAHARFTELGLSLCTAGDGASGL